MAESTTPELLGSEGQEALQLAGQFDDPSSLAGATALRKRFAPNLAAAAASQVTLRRKAAAKFGADAAGLYFTSAGLEQATRPAVATWRARRFVEAGVTNVIDVGCGIGADLRGFVAAGLTAIGIEIDPLTAAYAAANVPAAEVICGAAESELPALLVSAPRSTAIFIDPARRNAHGRTWNVADFVPAWDFVLELLDSGHPICVKLGPGLPRELIPDDVQVTWVSDHGDLVEASLWRLPGQPASEAAVLLPQQEVLRSSHRVPPLAAPQSFIHEPAGAVIRARAIADVAPDATLLAPEVAYLSSATPIDSPFLTSFEVLETLPFDEAKLRAWVRANDVGTLEIKKRAVDLDPAALRRRLKPKGKASATLLISPTTAGVRVFVVRRVSAGGLGTIEQN